MSSFTLVTWVARADDNGARTIELLVVWRGTQGWYLRGTRQGTSGGGSGASFHTTITYGEVELQLEFNSQTRIAQIQGKTVQLGDANVVLADDVDTRGGLKIAGTVRVDPELPLGPSGYPRVEAVLRRSSEIVSFLRCDVRPEGQPVMDAFCAQILAR